MSDDTGGPAFPHIDSGCGRFEEGMTLRQYAAIHLKVPDSGTDWLDEMIKKSAQYGIIEYSIEETTAGDPSDAVEK
jgi:hypothetical protein